MPGRDRTGPLGGGRLTGRGLGPCGGYGADYGPFAGRRAGRFCAFGPFGGRGGFARPFRFFAGSEEDEREALKEHREFLKRRLDEIDKELDE